MATEAGAGTTAAAAGPQGPQAQAKGPQVRVTIESLRAFGIEAFTAVGVPEHGATIIAEVQLESNLRGQPTHHLGDVPRYARQIAAGAMNPRPEITVVGESPVHALVDGDNGPGQWVSVVAMRRCIAKAKESGLATVAARRSNHFGAAGHYAYLALKEDLIGLCTTSGGPVIAPWGGVERLFGNNPLGVGIPAGRERPVLLDIAMSVAAQGKVGAAIRQFGAIPEGWYLDRFGRPTTDPEAFRLGTGSGMPMGGHKGYGLAVVMETLAGLLTGTGICQAQAGDGRRETGHFFLAINPTLFLPLDEFKARVDAMVRRTKASPAAEGVERLLLPGEFELEQREANLRAGSVPLAAGLYEQLARYAEEGGLRARLELAAENG